MDNNTRQTVCQQWLFGKNARGYNAEWRCGAPATDTCDSCGEGRCDAHMEIKRDSGRPYGKSMCSIRRHS